MKNNQLNDLDKILSMFFGFDIPQPNKFKYPPVNQYLLTDENNNRTMVIEVALAGKDKDSVELHLSENNKILNLEVSKNNNEDEKNRQYLERNIADRSIKISFPIYFLTTKELIDTNLDNGMLTIKIKERKAENTKIDIL